MKNRIFNKAFTASLVCIFVLIVSAMVSFASQDDDWRTGQIAVTGPDIPKDGNAYVIFSEVAEEKGMEYIKPNGAGRYTDLYSEQTVWNGVQSRQVYVENYLYFKLDEGFADAEDRVFEITLDYWDYGGGGYFYVEYLTPGSNEVVNARVYKLGLDANGVKTAGTWFRAKVYIDNADFTGRMDNGASFRIRSGAYNSFSKVEVRNLSKTATADEDFGVYNIKKANSLHTLRLFEGFEGDVNEKGEFNPDLTRVLTKEEAIVQFIKSYNLEEKALSEKHISTFTDVSEDVKYYVGLMQHMGLIGSGTILGANEPLKQKEAVEWYLKILDIDTKDKDIYQVAFDKGIISKGSMIFQPEKNLTVDNFVVLATNVLAKSNEKTGFNLFTDMFEKGIYNEQDIKDANDSNITNWLLENSFKLEPIHHTDPYSGREYYSLSFLGSSAIKDYYTQNCMSMDMKKLYFRTEDLNLFEYDMETGECKYIGTLMEAWNYMVTPLNNLWYLNKKGQIIKVNLETYEQTVEGELPEFQKRRGASMLQVNNDESKLSFEWSDASGQIDVTKEQRIPIYDIVNKEWDLSHKWGFITPWHNPNHMCINPNPAYSNYVFFAHEGNSVDMVFGNQRADGQTPQYDRVWAVNTDTDEYYNVYVQKYFVEPDPDIPGSGYTGQSSVHEAWSNDGEWLFVVKNAKNTDNITREIREAGCVMMRPDGSDKKYIPTPYNFTHDNGYPGSRMVHGMVSNNNRWVAGDTTYSSSHGYSDLYLFDTWTGKEYFLARINETGNNFGHVHPQFSPDDNMVIFGLWSDDNSHPQVGWIDVSDIVNAPIEGGEYKLSESCRTFGYSDCEHYIIPQYDENEEITSFKVPAGNKLYVDVNKTVVEKDNTPATITITYKDDTNMPIKFTYYTWEVNGRKGTNRFKEHTEYINRKGTGKVLTKTYTFEDICLGNMELFGSDFNLSAVGADAEIISVDVSVPAGKE